MSTTRYFALAGRLLVGAPFVLFGLGKATTYDATLGMIQAAGLPFPPLAFLGAVTLEILGGLMLIAGLKVRPVALLLALFSIVTAIFFHGNLADQNMFVHFFKNVMIAGGLLQVAAFGAGDLSLEAILSRRRVISNSVMEAR